MILISIQPFALKKIIALGCTVVCLATASCFASSMFLPVESTPYDRQVSRIQPVLSSPKKVAPKQQVSLSIVNQWMGDLRDIPYGFHVEWKTPSEVQSREPADCKGKAVALYDRMHASGARNVRLVIGRRTPTSRSTHAWLEWETDNGRFMLDPTFNWMACRLEALNDQSYVPLYAFAGGKKYRAAASSTLYANN